MCLIAMAVFDTEENKRSEYTQATIDSILKTVDLNKHRFFIIDNNSCEETKQIYQELPSEIQIIELPENVGTAQAINKAWRHRLPGEHCIKIDNDIVVHKKGWVDDLAEAITREPRIGQIGLKRKDCWEYPEHESRDYRSRLIMLPHKPGERWIIVEQAKHIIGSCVMHSSALLDNIGYLWQPGLYGYDDVLISWRANLSGFICCFLPHIEIDHIDSGDTPYQGWKEKHSGQFTKEVSDIVDDYISGKKSLYYE